jgi:hypothetical protein
MNLPLYQGFAKKKKKEKSKLPPPPKKNTVYFRGGRWTGEQGRGAGLLNTCHWEACGTVSE